MLYKEYNISPALQPFVKVIWSMESDTPAFDSGPGTMRILPDTCVELVVHFKDPYKTIFADNTTSLQPQSMIVAQMKSFIEIRPQGKTGIFAVRFSAYGARHFLGMPMHEVANGETPLSYVWKNLATEIEERIFSATNNDIRCNILQQYLLTLLAKNGRHDTAIDFCLTEIYQSHGQISVEALAYNTGISNRQLVRRFNNCVGLSPKEFSRITKFIHALNFMNRFPEKSLTEVGYDCGYYDQAHFIRDFKEYSGLTPGEYLASGNVVY